MNAGMMWYLDRLLAEASYLGRDDEWSREGTSMGSF